MVLLDADGFFVGGAICVSIVAFVAVIDRLDSQIGLELFSLPVPTACLSRWISSLCSGYHDRLVA